MVTRPSPALQDAVAPGVRVPHIEPLWQRIERNRLKFVTFMVLFTTALAATAFFFVLLPLLFLTASALSYSSTVTTAFWWTVAGGAFAVALVAAWVFSLVAFSRAEVTLIRRLGAQMPKGGTLLETKSMLRDMSIAAGLPATPQFYVIETKGVNAFVLGRSIEHIRIGVTTGLLERIPADEQRAVFANLIARVLARDTLWATTVSALMGPIWKMRDYDLTFEPVKLGVEDGSRERTESSDWRAANLFGYGLAVVITEFLAWYHREAAWKAAEKADAEGMMLLKDPRSMLGAIEHVLERDNHVPAAGDAYSQLFFCWAGFGFAPEDDPEMRRVSRMREALGAEGCAALPRRPNVPDWNKPPIAPYLELAEQLAEGGNADEVWP
jgi:Zn-dependent protease with chaperone function